MKVVVLGATRARRAHVHLDRVLGGLPVGRHQARPVLRQRAQRHGRVAYAVPQLADLEDQSGVVDRHGAEQGGSKCAPVVAQCALELGLQRQHLVVVGRGADEVAAPATPSQIHTAEGQVMIRFPMPSPMTKMRSFFAISSASAS